MQQLVVAGLIYLLGIAVVLAVKPSLMFNSDGTWKEFGIGRNPATHTILPFWLFAVLWALLSYIIVTFVFILLKIRATPSVTLPSAPSVASVASVPAQRPNIATVELDEEVVQVIPKRRSRPRAPSVDLADGYYILNTKATEEAGGIPKYIYLGKGLPEA
jgi:hypothetical protein